MSRSPTFSVNNEFHRKIDLKSLLRWVVAFCTIRFDLEQGQVIEECYPSGCFTKDQELEIAFSSFPDSVSQNKNRTSIHDSIFFFRLPRLEPHDSSPCFLYGYVFNRQRHDERLRRGGEQKSVLILSLAPYSAVFRPLLQIMAPLYFDIGRKALEHVASHVSSWPPPEPGQLMELPIGNASLKVNLPPPYCLPLPIQKNDIFLAQDPSSSSSLVQGLFHDSDLFGTLKGILLQLWLLWELLIIGEPILVIAPTPPQCSEAVAALVSLLAPLLCSIDFRPYFTIHDQDFSNLNSLQGTFPPVILGVTNLFFVKALRNMPHIVSVGCPGHSTFARSRLLQLRRFSPSSLLKLNREGPLCLMTEHKEAVWSSYSAIVKPDTSILNRLVDAPRVEQSMSVVNNEILRRHFLELTSNFLAPFSPYFRATTPLEGSSPFLDTPPLPTFCAQDFLHNLSARGPGKFLQKRMRSNWLDLYRRFLKGHNFMPWFQRKRAVAEKEQHRLWREARMRTDIHLFISKMSELEMVDSFNAIERYIVEEIHVGKKDGREYADKLKGDLQAVFDVLPIDMQLLLLSNPQRSALLRKPS